MQDGNNPYQAPAASITEHDPKQSDLQFSAPGRQVPSGDGWTWISEAWRLFTAAPVLWIVAFILLFAIYIVVSLVPIVGSIAPVLFGPSLVAGIVAFAYAIDKGEPADINHLFDGFRQRLSPLIIVGLISFGMTLAVMVVTGLIGFALLSGSVIFNQLGGSPAQLTQALTQNVGASLDILLIGLIFLALLLPVMAAYWFAPALVFFAGLEPFEAIKASFSACFRNFIPFLVYSIIFLLLSVVAAIPLGLGFFVLMPVGMASIYTSFKGIYGVAR